jgi:hypothetical protein
MSNQIRPEVGDIANRPAKGDTIMDTTTLLIIVVVVLLIGGGGFYGRGRWY